MTPKQEDRIRNKIARIRKELAADKKRWGGFYDDSRGLRYLPPEQFIKLRDYKGGLRYLRWFNRTFPDDSGYPIFLFEWTLILFKTGNLKEAENKALQTLFANNYLFNKFLGNELIIIEKKENSNWESAELAEILNYSQSDPEFADFGKWLENFHTSEKFIQFTNELIEIERKLATEPLGKARTELVNRRRKLIDEL
jgi:hypothetical protein